MDKSTVILRNLEGFEGRCNDVVFCGSEGQQHVVFFPGDVQVSMHHSSMKTVKQIL